MEGDSDIPPTLNRSDSASSSSTEHTAALSEEALRALVAEYLAASTSSATATTIAGKLSSLGSPLFERELYLTITL